MSSIKIKVPLCTCGSDQVSVALQDDGFQQNNCQECGAEWVTRAFGIRPKIHSFDIRTQVRFDTDGRYYLKVDKKKAGKWVFWMMSPKPGVGGYDSPLAAQSGFWLWLGDMYQID